MAHIARIAFCGLRRLNQFRSRAPDPFHDWLQVREWHRFAAVNVFIGANGAGKSTVLELIDLLRCPERIVTLPRENRTADALAAFHFVFGDGDELIGMVAPNQIRDQPVAANVSPATGGLDIQFASLLGRKAGSSFFSFDRNISKIDLDADSRSTLAQAFEGFDARVAYWRPGGELALDALIDELNAARIHLCGMLSDAEWMDDAPPDAEYARGFARHSPCYALDDGRVAMHLSDDSRQHNHVAVDALPAGWRQLASIVTWLKQVPEGALCLLEEPETHLHPHLQRYLAARLASIADQRGLQLFIATHSPVFQQLNVWPHGANLFEVRPTALSELNSAWRVLDALGIRGADISQSNGVIWVEGASDRLYIKHWLTLYCAAHGMTAPVENVEYSFSLYGGASLSHFGVEDTESFIDMLGINRNLAVVIDRDLDFRDDGAGALVCVKPASAKARILQALATFGSERAYAWVTDGYTIESYLPDAIRNRYFEVVGGRLVLKPGQRKTAIAAQYMKAHGALDGCSASEDALSGHVGRLLALIRAWNR